ncbi:hypothetical protein BH09BAC1_BH09BAC1_01520 [soil metagenome]
MTTIQKKKYGTIAFTIFIVLALFCCFWPSHHPVNTEPFDTGTLAWMLTAAGLILLMTPGLSFFYGGNDKSEKYNFYHAAKLCSVGCGELAVVRGRF